MGDGGDIKLADTHRVSNDIPVVDAVVEKLDHNQWLYLLIPKEATNLKIRNDFYLQKNLY